MANMSRGPRPETLPDRVKDLEGILFLDIETVPVVQEYGLLDPTFQKLWQAKSAKYARAEETPEELFHRWAGIHAEFARVLCASVGFFKKEDGKYRFRVKCYADEQEAALLENFRQLLDKHFGDCRRHWLCAHNGIEFDFPFLARRMVINSVALPNLLNVSGTKSWNNPWLIDTMDLWRFGDIKDKTSLDLLAAALGIESPKGDISGADVARVFYEQGDLERIVRYCNRDVYTVAKVFLRLSGARFPHTEGDIVEITG